MAVDRNRAFLSVGTGETLVYELTDDGCVLFAQPIKKQLKYKDWLTQTSIRGLLVGIAVLGFGRLAIANPMDHGLDLFVGFVIGISATCLFLRSLVITAAPLEEARQTRLELDAVRHQFKAYYQDELVYQIGWEFIKTFTNTKQGDQSQVELILTNNARQPLWVMVDELNESQYWMERLQSTFQSSD